MPYFAKLFSVLAILVIQLLISGSAQAKNPLIAAASSLRIVMAELEKEFVKTGGTKLRMSFGSSGNLARQILQGGPYELFLAADTAYITPLVKKGKTQGRGKPYAFGRLALITHKKARLNINDGLASLLVALKKAQLKHLAIANPQHAPYGRAAKQALTHVKVWQDIQPFLIFGENIAQTTQFALSSRVNAGLISYSLALAPAVSAKTHNIPLPANWHAPIRHHMVLLKNASKGAQKFYEFMTMPKAQEILSRYGFSPAAIK